MASDSTLHQRILTVDNKWKVEQELQERLSRKSGPSRLVPIAKWTATIIMGCGVLFLFIATKVTFLTLATLLQEQKPDKNVDAGNIDKWTKYSGQMLMIYLVLLVPYALQFLRAVKRGVFARNIPWPKLSGVMSCITAGVLEPLGLVLLALKVVPCYGPSLGLVVTACSIALPVATASLLTCAGHGEGARAGGYMGLACILILGGLGGTWYMIFDYNSDIANIIHVVACMLCLNVAWLPWLQHQMNQSAELVMDITSVPNVRGYGCINTGSSDSAIGSYDSSLDPTQTQIQAMSTPYRGHGADRTTFYKRATWKASLIFNFTRLVSTSFFCFLFFYVDVTGSNFNLTPTFSDSMHTAFLNGWQFSNSIVYTKTFWMFGWNLIGGLVCYVLAFIIFHCNMHKGSMALPLVLSVPLSLLVVSQSDLCNNIVGDDSLCDGHVGSLEIFIPTVIALVAGQFLSFGKQVFVKGHVNLLNDSELFWTPGYNGVALDTWILLNWRTSLRAGELGRRAAAKPPKMRVYICTTMYREDEDEMRQLLESLHRINIAQADGETFFESHVIFDGGVQRKKISEFALVLISLLEDTLDVKPSLCTKVVTPYGLRLSWGLPSVHGKPQMKFHIHLKDNMMVKNKKRWSQIMYMSYVLDYLSMEADPTEESYILTTDADIKFTPDSVEALLDLMSRDNTIGAVCARTHPTGAGPLVWYQTFEYAVGHWFQKAAEHVMGSVLCAPGCFSVYRCRALRDIVPKYCKKVESAFDFLTKDMGEDRWLCTLLVQSGWRIEYCAASENRTNCPAQFEEFYKQRRRWIASTLANLMLVIREWSYIDLFNERVSVLFLFYQGLLLFSTMIAPSTVILIVAGGLTYAWGFDSVAGIILQVLACLMFTAICLYMSQKAQFRAAKLLTFVYAAVMCAVAVGTAQQIVDDLNRPSSANSTSKPAVNGTASTTTTTTARPASDISVDVQASITTIYFIFLVGVYFIAGLLHPREIYCLAHGLWYLLCLPSGYLILTIYSICNLTDSSWGTREGDKESAVIKKKSWHDIYKETFYYIFFCCDPRETTPPPSVESQVHARLNRSRSTSTSSNVAYGGESAARHDEVLSDLGNIRSTATITDAESDLTASGDYHSHQETAEAKHAQGEEEDEVPIPVEEWLPQEFKSKYADILKRHGFDNTLFLKAVTEKELMSIDIVKRGHVQYLLAQVALLPAFEIEYQVPTNVKDWLQDIGLIMYRDNFRRNHIRTPKEMEILKRFDRKDIARELGITKEGHIKRLLYAIRMLRDPSEGQIKAMKMRQTIDDTPVHYLIQYNPDEFHFWTTLKERCLEPDLKAFGIDAEIKIKLVQLRNNWLTILAVSNTLWLILITTLATKADLVVIGANPIGLVFLFIFGFLFLLQFLSMLVHRTYTLSHYLARASYTYGKAPNSNWSFRDKHNRDNFEDTEDVNAARRKEYDEERAYQITLQSNRRERPPLVEFSTGESTPLLRNL